MRLPSTIALTALVFGLSAGIAQADVLKLAQAPSGEPSDKAAAKKKKDQPVPTKSDEPSKKKKGDEPKAADPEPASPGPSAGEPTPPAAEPAAPGSGEPASSSEPKGTSGEPSGTTGGEPTSPAGEPVAPKAAAPVAVAAKAVKRQFGLGFNLRSIFIHQWTMGLFLDESTPLNSMAFGGEFVYRKGTFDIVLSAEFGLYSPQDGNYLGKGKNPATDVDYLQFDNLNILAFGVHFIKHHPIMPWVSFVWGGGVGLGIVTGKIYRVSAGKGCDASTAGDEARCYPHGTWDPNNPDAWLNDPANAGVDGDSCAAGEKGKGNCDDPNNPKRFEEAGVWPVVPLVHLMVGFDFKITESFGVRVDGGFRNSFYIGAAGHYFF